MTSKNMYVPPHFQHEHRYYSRSPHVIQEIVPFRLNPSNQYNTTAVPKFQASRTLREFGCRLSVRTRTTIPYSDWPKAISQDIDMLEREHSTYLPGPIAGESPMSVDSAA
jgi:hypothetical protein